MSGYAELLQLVEELKKQDSEVQSIADGGKLIEPGIKVMIEYEGKTYTGESYEYCQMPSGDYALGVKLDVDVGMEVKYFSASQESYYQGALAACLWCLYAEATQSTE